MRYVKAVLPRLAGLDALDGDAEAQPPDATAWRGLEQGIGAGEGDAVVGSGWRRAAPRSNRCWEAAIRRRVESERRSRGVKPGSAEAWSVTVERVAMLAVILRDCVERLPLEVGERHKSLGCRALPEGRAPRPVAPADAGDIAKTACAWRSSTVMDGAGYLRGRFRVMSPGRPIGDRAGSRNADGPPARLVALARGRRGPRAWQYIGQGMQWLAWRTRPARAVGEGTRPPSSR